MSVVHIFVQEREYLETRTKFAESTKRISLNLKIVEIKEEIALSKCVSLNDSLYKHLSCWKCFQ